MFEKLADRDPVLNGRVFREDEVRYNLLHFICNAADALRIRTTGGELIFAQTPGFNPWLWLSPWLGEERKRELLWNLAEHVRFESFPGVFGAPEIAETFARYYTEGKELRPERFMMLKAYSCTEVKPPEGVAGAIERANSRHTERVAAYMTAFSEEVFKTTPVPGEVYKAATTAIATGGLYVWTADGNVVSMARIAHRHARHARINDVYTPPGERRKGYASALVAILSDYCIQEGLTPMLYADADNPDSNRVYRSIGFAEAGKIADIRFRPQ